MVENGVQVARHLRHSCGSRRGRRVLVAGPRSRPDPPGAQRGRAAADDSVPRLLGQPRLGMGLRDLPRKDLDLVARRRRRDAAHQGPPARRRPRDEHRDHAGRAVLVGRRRPPPAPPPAGRRAHGAVEDRRRESRRGPDRHHPRADFETGASVTGCRTATPGYSSRPGTATRVSTISIRSRRTATANGWNERTRAM